MGLAGAEEAIEGNKTWIYVSVVRVFGIREGCFLNFFCVSGFLDRIGGGSADAGEEDFVDRG